MKFSIIIALAPNRSAPVLSCLNNLDYPKKDFEILIEKGLNPSNNRNKGIQKAKGDIILFLDDDCYVEKSLLKNAENFFIKHSFVDVLGGPQLTPSTDNLFAKTVGYVISSFFGSHKMAVRYKKSKLNLNADYNSLTSAICFIKKDVFTKTLGFNVNLWPGEDPELFARFKKLGFNLAYSPDIFIYHKRRDNISSFFEQHLKYGYFAFKKEKLASTKMTLLYYIPALFAIYLLTLPLAFLIKIYWAPFILYLLIVLFMAFKILISKRDFRMFLLTPLIYFLEHVSYGIGALFAFIKK